ncbi:hypothetical protein CRG98_011382 [Punica granatum]|uniref:Uncharacterized protein n=1 Tax=Punica granatum TaxID=22663 RepID=A0A2I0KKE2_PUNGR|nr:hypothetical protein CRG98_011382 [Punica granatum]
MLGGSTSIPSLGEARPTSLHDKPPVPYMEGLATPPMSQGTLRAPILKISLLSLNLRPREELDVDTRSNSLRPNSISSAHDGPRSKRPFKT